MRKFHRKLIPWLPFIILAAAAAVGIWHLMHYH
jgi:hypothetical protein